MSHIQTILLRLPNWLGDSVMCASAFEKLKIMYPKASFVLVGSYACEIYARDKRVTKIFIDESKKHINRILATYTLAQKIKREVGKIDIGICFNNGFYGALLIFFVCAHTRIGYKKNLRSAFLTHTLTIPQTKPLHQVQKYEYLVKNLLDSEIFYTFTPLNLVRGNASKISHNKNAHNPHSKSIGINPGAAFGSAKCWEKEYFIEIISRFVALGHTIYIFGDTTLNPPKNPHIYDLSNQTTIYELIDSIGDLDLFITNDSGPMHIAAALNTPTIAIFGSTDTADTCPWNEAIAQRFFISLDSDISTYNEVFASKMLILSKHLVCSPCKKRVCPLKHHLCMKTITPDEVFESALTLLGDA